MTETAHVLFPAQPGRGPELLDWLRAKLPDTRARPGCVDFQVFAITDEPDNVVLWQTWDDRSHHQEYAQWRRDIGDLAERDEMLTGPTTCIYLTAHPDV